MKKVTNRMLLSLRLIFAMLLTVNAMTLMAAQAVDWRPTLVKPKSGMFAANSTIKISLPKEVTSEILQHLALELDDIDVTSMVSMTGNIASVTPTQPMAFGKHHLRLVEYAQDGSIIERGDWTLDVRQNKRFREAKVQTNTTLNATYRLTQDSTQTNLPSRTQGNGAAAVAAAIADDNWQFTGNADLLYNSQKQLMPRHEQTLDLAQFLVTAKSGALTAAVGRQSLEPESLIMSGFPRRGVSLGLKTADSTASVTGFALHAQDIVGFQQGMGVSNSDNRIQGLIADYRPISKNPNALLLSATYLKGTGPTQSGVASAASTTVTSGDAGSVSADGQLLDNRLRLRGEYAHTNYNYDYLDPASQDKSDYAYSALAQYTPWQNKIVGGQPMVINFGIERTRIGTFFRSMANPTGISDRNGVQGMASLNWNGFSSQLMLGRVTDNVDDIAQLPDTHMTQSVISLSYTPVQVPGSDGQPPKMPWYGQPSYFLTYANADLVVDKTGSLPTTTGGLHSTRNMTFSAAFNYTMSNWSLSETLGSDDDKSNLGPDTDTRQTQVNANLYLNDKLSLGPSLQYSKVSNKNDPGQDSTTNSVGLNIMYTISERLSTNLNYTMNHQKISDGSSDIKSQDTVANISWLMQSATPSKPGITLSAEGLLHKIDDSVIAANNADNYSLNLKLTVSFATGY